MTWTIERVDRLTTMHVAGYSAGKIAADLGSCTRNGVIGKIHRLGLQGHGRPVSQFASGPKRSKPRTQRVTPALKRPQPAHYLDAIQAADTEALPVEESAFACTLVDLNENTCRFPLGDPQSPSFGFCGAKPHGSLVYCARHCVVAYAVPRTHRRAA